MSEPETPSAPSQQAPVEKPVVFRPYPKVVFLWPIVAVAILITLGSLVWQGGFLVPQVVPHEDMAAQAGSPAFVAVGDYNISTGRIVKPAWGNLFFVLFFINVLVLAYDFDVTKSVAAFLGGVAVIAILLWLNSEMDILADLKSLLGRIKITVNLQFMLGVSAVGLMTAGVIWVHSRFNWWELTHNELIHRKRFLGDTRRFPALNLRMTKEIPDVMELLTFFGCGRLVFNVPGENRAIVLEHVPFVNKRERQIKDKLGSLSIRHEYPDYHPEP